MEAICGAKCDECELFKNNKCKGCNGCPFGKKCWIASYIQIGGKKNFELLKRQMIDDINSLNIDGMPKLDNLYILNGSFVNLEYTLPNGKKVTFLNDDEAYLGCQVECEFDKKKCFGIVANMSFYLICEYGENGSNPEIVLFERR